MASAYACGPGHLRIKSTLRGESGDVARHGHYACHWLERRDKVPVCAYSALRANFGEAAAAAPQILRPTAMFFDVLRSFCRRRQRNSRFTLHLQAVAAIHAPKWRLNRSRWRQLAPSQTSCRQCDRPNQAPTRQFALSCYSSTRLFNWPVSTNQRTAASRDRRSTCFTTIRFFSKKKSPLLISSVAS